MNWYRIDFSVGESRFIEVDHNLINFERFVSEGYCVKVARQVLCIPVQAKPKEVSINFATLDQLSPPVASCLPDNEYINLKKIVGFGVVDTDSDLWEHVRKTALKEAVIDTPGKNLIIS